MPHMDWRKKIFLTACEKPPLWNFLHFSLSPWSQCQKRRPQVNFSAFTKTFSVSPWSPCRNATYEFEKIFFFTACEKPTRWNFLALLFEVREVNAKRSDHMFFFSILQNLIWKSVKSVPKSHACIWEKIFLILVEGHPGIFFSCFILSPWSPCQRRRLQVNFLTLT